MKKAVALIAIVVAVLAVFSAVGYCDTFRYSNERFGFSIEYPGFFSPWKTPLPNDDGLILVDRAHQGGSVSAYAGNYGKVISPDYFWNEFRNAQNAPGYYTARGDSWYVISHGKNIPFMYYKKVFVGRGSWYVMTVQYRQEHQAIYDKIIEQLETSFKPGDISIPH